MFQRREASAFTNVGFVRRREASAFVDVGFVRRWSGAAWIPVWPLSSGVVYSLSTDTALGIFGCTGLSEECPFITPITSETVTASASSGTPTFLWSYVSGDSSITVSNPTAATVSFTGNVGRTQNKVAIWKCAVTVGAETKELEVTVNLFYNYTRTPGEIEP